LIEREGHKFVFTLPNESFISQVFLADNVKGIKGSTEGLGSVIRIPDDKNMVHADSSSIVSCQQETLGLISMTKIYKKLKNNGKIDFGKSDLSITPKPEHYMIIENKGKTIGMTMIWYKSKLNISSFHHPSVDKCNK